MLSFCAGATGRKEHMSVLIMGKAAATAEQMKRHIKNMNPEVEQSVLDMIPLYISEGDAEGVKGDVAFAQSCLETGNFKFIGSAVTLAQNNFCGMGVTAKGMKGNSFASPQLGIRAQIQHLKAYGSNQPLKQGCVDPRFHFVKRGQAEYVEWLGIQENPNHTGWAAGKGYGEKILRIYNDILKVEESEEMKMKINVHAGHNFKVPGASGCFSETEEDRKVKNSVITKLREQGHTVYDCTDEDGRTASENLQKIVGKCNAHTVDLDVSIHFNAYNGQAHGVEAYVYSNSSKAKPYAEKIVHAIAEKGYTNRGVKTSTGLYILKHTVSPALLIECCFCDNKEDAKKYNCEEMAGAIVKGITGKAVTNSGSVKPGPEIPVKNAVAGMLITGDTPVYTAYGGKENGKTIKKGQTVKPYARCWCGSTCWFAISGIGWIKGTTIEGWVLENGRWWYLTAGYKYPRSAWKKIGSAWYYFDGSGWMKENCILKLDGKYYALLPGGKMADKVLNGGALK